MGQVLVRNLDDAVVDRLKARADANGRSLEAELREILAEAARPSRAQLLEEMKQIRAMTPPGPRRLAEELVRESRDER